MRFRTVFPQGAAIVLASWVCGSAWGQSLALSSASAAPGTTVTLNLTLAGGGNQVGGLQWTLAYTPSSLPAVAASAGPVLQSSGKTLTCAARSGSYSCVAEGLNANAIPDGVVATVAVTLSSTLSGSTSIGVSGELGGALTGSAITLTATGGSITSTGGGLTPSSAVFAGLNTTLQGKWKGTYGSDGYAVAGDLARYPSYAAVAVSAPTAYIWTPATTDTRALQKASSAAGLLAAAWYGATSLSIDVNLTGGGTHQVALYCLDWTQSSRAETITVLDANSKAVLDTRSITGFGTGQYVAWRVSGHVTIQVALASGPSAVVSGIFFGGGATTPAASFVRSDAATEGSWPAVYGGEGYNVIASAAAYPGYAAVTTAGTQQYVWSSSTSDPRALEKPNSPADRVAGAWYSATSFTVNLNLSDTVTHQLALYCLDWDAQQRAETITILNAGTGAVLDTRAVSSFSGGQYLVWNVRGSVQILVTRTSGPNALLSGIFVGGAPSGPAADYVSTDTSSQGTWSGVYGADGYNVVGDLTSYPSYVTVTPAAESSYTWTTFTTDPRALERASNLTSRVAAAWYSGSTFNIDLNFANAVPYRVAVYCLDWDNRQRQQEVSVVNPATNAILDSRIITSFSGGQYLVWNLTGHVKIVFLSMAPPNAVMSGMFLR